MHDSTIAVPEEENPHTAPAILSQITRKGKRVILADGREVEVTDRNRDTDAKRRRAARSRYKAAVTRWGLDAVVYEYRLTFPAHLDVLDELDADTMRAMIEALDPDAFYKLEDVRNASPFPINPHAHLLSTRDLPPMPGLWRHPEPLDLYTVNLSDDDTRTVYGFFWYTAKPALGGAVRPTPRQYKKLRQQFSKDELVRHLLVAQQRTNAAQARAWAQSRGNLPDTVGWLIGGKKRRKQVA